MVVVKKCGLRFAKAHLAVQGTCLGAVRGRGEHEFSGMDLRAMVQCRRDQRTTYTASSCRAIDHDIFDPSLAPRGDIVPHKGQQSHDMLPVQSGKKSGCGRRNDARDLLRIRGSKSLGELGHELLESSLQRRRTGSKLFDFDIHPKISLVLQRYIFSRGIPNSVQIS